MIKTGTEELDNFLENYKGLTTLYGEGGSGKTTLCMLAAIEQALNNKKVLYLDTEINFSADRFEQILNNRNKECIKNILVLKIKNFNLQHTQIKTLEGIKNISLIIVDSITHHYRRLYSREPEIARAMLGKQLSILKEISKTIPIIITSQVYSNMENSSNLLARETIKKYSDKIIRLEKNPRKMIIETTNKTTSFEIVGDGIKLYK
ncbi:AAA family ATPase [Candidatus Woesearchaeota archaeon]|nr:MAG: DNA repair protein RadB [archaeon GW2011_AR18]MBS3161264.1 AAA family ATPase [Candidatus Woesearchaeota archaeon]HIH25682.1 AAA family ATPase [Nanoarchaeota archaeon]